MPAQDEYTFAPPAGPDEAGEKDTILLRQATVEQQKVRARPVTHSEDATPAGHLGNHGHPVHHAE